MSQHVTWLVHHVASGHVAHKPVHHDRFLHLNKLTGAVPATLSFPHATDIMLSNNQLTGHIPWSSLLNSSVIQTIAINNNMLRGPLPQHLPSSLVHFVAHVNSFTGAMPSFNQTPALQTLSVHRNELVGDLVLPTLREWNATCRDRDEALQQFDKMNGTTCAKANSPCGDHERLME